ncbi:MAG TPA: chorismate mutase [Opitutales bacterium]|nr:chorismate mutase [Opitutales bacterium]
MHYSHPTATASLGSLSDMRKRIDDIDERIIHLLMERIQVVQGMSVAKLSAGEALHSPIRVRSLLKRLTKMAKFPLTEEAIVAIYREVISASLLAQKRLVVGFSGCETSLCARAAHHCFGSSLRYRPFVAPVELLQQTRKHTIDYAVVPDNAEGLEAIFEAARDGLELMVFDQVQLSAHARFWVVGHQSLKYEPGVRFSSLIVVTAPNVPGSWQNVLIPFTQHNIDLIKMVSLDGPSPSEHTRLYLECNGHVEDPVLKSALDSLADSGVKFYRLGSYVDELEF